MDYGKTSGYSTLGRKILLENYCSGEEKYLHYFMQSIKICLLHSFLMNFKQYSEFPFGTPMNVAIAQHYGMDTYYLDFTDDVKVVLFFASCKHTKENVYEPITEADLSYIGRYGVLYSKSIGMFDEIEPIGSQGVIDKEGTILIRTEAPAAGITGLAKTVDFQKCILKGLQN